MLVWIIAILAAAYALYKYISKDFDYFKKNGLKNIKPFSNIFMMFSKEFTLGDLINYIYREFPNEK